MIIAAFFTLALAAIAVFLRALRPALPSRRRIGPAVLALAAGAALLARPHEDILGGLDGGAYLCMGARLAAEQSPFYADAFLEDIPPADRPAFLYPYPYDTKYGPEWIRDLETTRTGPWFQPAYPLLLSGVIRVFGLRAALYVVPLFCLAAALLLGRLAFLVTDAPRARWVSPLLYLTCPLVIWQGRSPRPEVIASFFTLAGLCLLLDNRNASRSRLPDLLLAGLAFALAPLFHILAGPVTLLVSIGVYVRLWQGHRRDGVFFIPLAAGFALFLAQTLFWTDTYSLARFVRPLFVRPLILLPLLAALATLIALPLLLRRNRDAPRLDRPLSSRLNLLAGAGLAVVVAGVYAWALLTRPDYSQPPAYHYIHRTDLPSAVSFLSWPVALAALAGAILIFAAPRRFPPRARPALLLLGIPALIIGDIHDLFMTRYFMVSLVPAAVLAITALLTRGLAPAESRRRRALPPLLALLVILPLPTRLPLVRVTENHGFLRAFEKIARPVREANGRLVVEYSRLGAPFEHLFGIPTLPLDNEHLPDYQQTERALAAAFEHAPEQPLFFLTPFRTPLSERFTFRLMDRRRIPHQQVLSRRWALPKHVAPRSLSLSLFEMHLAPPDPAPSPALYPADPALTGLRRIGKSVHPETRLDGWNITPSLGLRLPPLRPDSTAYLIFWTQANEPPVFQAADSNTSPIPTAPLLPNWHLLTLEAGQHPATLLPRIPVRLHAAFEFADGVSVPLDITRDVRDNPLSSISWRTPLHFRWADSSSRFGLPVSGRPLLLLLNLADPSPVPIGIQIAADQTPVLQTNIPPNQWQWLLCPPPPVPSPFTWLHGSVQAPDPRLALAAWGDVPLPPTAPSSDTSP